MSLGTFFIRVSFRPVFPSSIVRTGLSILDSGSAIFLSVVEALTVKTQILVPVARHVVVLSHSSVFSKGNVVVAFFFWCCQSVKLFIHFLSYLVPERGPFKSLTTSMKNTYCLFQVKFITEYMNVQHVIITQILLKLFN